MNLRNRWACLLAPCLLATATQAGAIDLGDASVWSQQGQRLKVAIPYGSTPGERVSALRFTVASAVSADGHTRLSPDGFTISKPARRNFVLLQSSEPVSARLLRLVVQVGDDPASRTSYDLAVPAAHFTPVADTMASPAASGVATKARRHHRRPSRAKPPAPASQAPVDKGAQTTVTDTRPAGLG